MSGDIMNYFSDRFKEPSTWRGLALLGSVFASKYVSPEQALQVVEYGLGIAGVFGLVTPDKR
jgi:hypothetical protein